MGWTLCGSGSAAGTSIVARRRIATARILPRRAAVRSPCNLGPENRTGPAARVPGADRMERARLRAGPVRNGTRKLQSDAALEPGDIGAGQRPLEGARLRGATRPSVCRLRGPGRVAPRIRVQPVCQRAPGRSLAHRLDQRCDDRGDRGSHHRHRGHRLHRRLSLRRFFCHFLHSLFL